MKPRAGIENLPEYKPGRSTKDTIKLSSNENPFGPSPRAIQAIEESQSELHIYPNVRATELCKALAAKYEQYGLSADQVIVGNGSDEVILFAVIAFLANCIDDPEEVIVGEHSFSMYTLTSQMFNGAVRPVAMPKGEYALDVILAAICDKTRIIFLTSPNNPTGCILQAPMLEELLAKLPKDILLVIDEAYGDFADDMSEYQSAIPYVNEHDNLLVLRTFSKIYGLAGLRVGYGIAQKELIDILLRVKPPFNNSSFAIAGAIAALQDHEFIHKTKQCVAEGKEKLLKCIRALSLPYFPTYPNFISFQVPELADTAVEGIAQKGIMLRSLRSFGLDTCIRATIGRPERMDILIRVLYERYG